MSKNRFIFTLVCAVVLSLFVTLMAICWLSLDIPSIMTVTGSIFLTALIVIIWAATVLFILNYGKSKDKK